MSFANGSFPRTSHAIHYVAASSYVFYNVGPLGYDVDTNAAIMVAISALTMMEGRLLSLACILRQFFLLHVILIHFTVYGETFGERD